MSVLVLGYFGYVNNQLDGQTVKTRSIFSLVRGKIDGDVYYFDTQEFKVSKLRIFLLVRLLMKVKVLIYLPAQGNLKYVFPFIYFLSKILGFKINYAVVGGWLVEFLKDKPIHRYMLSRIHRIFAETETVYRGLQGLGFSNVSKLHNFRLTEYPEVFGGESDGDALKLCYMGRVNPLKGVDTIFKLEKELKRAGLGGAVAIDLYGPISPDYQERFFRILKGSSVNYFGPIEPDCIYDVLRGYDLMLFPTKFYTEGFPGSILDAYICGVPVVATEWLNAHEFVEDGRTGFVVNFDNEEEFISTVLKVVKKPETLLILKEGALKKRDEYSSEKAWNIISGEVVN